MRYGVWHNLRQLLNFIGASASAGFMLSTFSLILGLKRGDIGLTEGYGGILNRMGA